MSSCIQLQLLSGSSQRFIDNNNCKHEAAGDSSSSLISVQGDGDVAFLYLVKKLVGP